MFCSQGCRPTTRSWLRLKSRRVCMAIVAAGVAGGGAGAAEAASGRNETPYSARVEQVLAYLDAKPLRLTSRPMVYEPSGALDQSHLPACVQGLTPADVAPTPASASSDFVKVAAALLYVATGGLDEAHNLVTPLSWGAPTAYAGRPVAGSPAAREAAYVHALVHRSEGLCDGEFGSGFSNANYWYGAAGALPEVQDAMLAAARRAARGQPQLEQFVAGHGERWDNARWVSLCATLAGEGKRAEPGKVAFVEGVFAAELRALLDHCLERAKQGR